MIVITYIIFIIIIIIIIAALAIPGDTFLSLKFSRTHFNDIDYPHAFYHHYIIIIDALMKMVKIQITVGENAGLMT